MGKARRLMTPRASLAGLVALAIAGAPGVGVLASTEVHRWVDEDGVVHLSDEAPGDGRSERIEVQEPMGAVPLENAREILERPIRRPGEDPTDDEPEEDADADEETDDEDETSIEDVPVPVELVDF
ncbi:DUF4124 domain-containing protein [Thioalkalivibrio sp. ALE23]|uniref:DUF4124 domain-containing protein n=1 Tax=Thioalkalivibrio sp. ALE23 TaxID=1265495 RepID=UPI0003A342E2|nr:DUF4124 domain-containing protein [Thioalkalivibrio sp. ALE23]